MIPIIENSKKYGDRTAIIDASGSYSYSELYESAVEKAKSLTSLGVKSQTILYIIPSGFEYISAQWAIWLCGKITVPVHIAHPKEEIEYLIEDTRSQILIYDDSLAEKVEGLKISKLSLNEWNAKPIQSEVALPTADINADALMIYTSGTTGKPKGVVIGHKQLDAQIRSLSQAWEWNSDDRILNMLPMHHIHGMVNISCCALYNGAILEMYPKFDAEIVKERMSSGELTLFMAVPTIYHKLIELFEGLSESEQKAWQSGMEKMRLMVSGSAALPIPVLEKWKAISEHTLLERYGMTEIGMALSNPLKGERRPGTVGQPLPFVEVKIIDEDGSEIIEPDISGELYVRGETVFKRYWFKEEETEEAFKDGWFMTGDVVEKSADGYYKILGRKSSDIIKSGGYKISALEIENVFLSHPKVKECAVVALPDEAWGEVIAAAVVGEVSEEELKKFLKDRLAGYKQPRKYQFTDALPRNAMGKLVKAEVKKWFLM